jgi:hypothetical protein
MAKQNSTGSPAAGPHSPSREAAGISSSGPVKFRAFDFDDVDRMIAALNQIDGICQVCYTSWPNLQRLTDNAIEHALLAARDRVALCLDIIFDRSETKPK